MLVTLSVSSTNSPSHGPPISLTIIVVLLKFYGFQSFISVITHATIKNPATATIIKLIIGSSSHNNPNHLYCVSRSLIL